MGWRDSLALIDWSQRSGYAGSTYSAASRNRSVRRQSRTLDYDPWRASPVGAAPFQAIASGRARPPSTPNAAQFPEKVNLSVPFSTRPPGDPPPPQPSTEGDILGSIGATIGNIPQHLNLANAVPWFMERTKVLADEFAKGVEDVPVAGPVAKATGDALGIFLSGLEAVSNAAAPALDAFPHWYRDSQLGDRAKVYRAIVKGEPIDPLNSFFMSGDLFQIPGINAPFQAQPPSRVGANAREAARQFAEYQAVLESSVDPFKRMGAEQRIALIADVLDIPESVKQRIRENPDGDLEAYLNEAPEGRRFSYQEGLDGIVREAGTNLLFYGAEYLSLLRVVGGVGVATRTAAAEIAPQFPTAAARLTTAASAAGRVTTAAAKLQKAAFASGMGTAAVTTAGEAIARMQGNEAAIAWFDRIHQTAPISDNPNVQLVTGFTVDPFQATGLLRRGIVKMAHGPDVVIGKVLGQRLLRQYEASDRMTELLARMYGTTPDVIDTTYIGPERFYETRGEAFDEVVGLAADVVIAGKSIDERIAIGAIADGAERTAEVLRRYGREVATVLEKHPQQIVSRFREHAWEYHQYPGAFNPTVAALNARDIRTFRRRTYEMRKELDAVAGYVDYLGPEGQAILRSEIDAAFPAADAVVPVSAVQDMIRRFPALRETWQGLIRGKATSVPRSVVDEMLARAEQSYAVATKRNPMRVRTGTDPVLRPDSPTLTRDYADALGTDVATVQAISDFNPEKPTGLDLLRAFVRDKVDGADADTMSPEALWTAASDYVDEVSRPWREAGERLVSAERGVQELTARLREFDAQRSRGVQVSQAEYDALSRQIAEYRSLIQSASDPLTPFSAKVRFAAAERRDVAREAALLEAARRKVDARLRLDDLAAINATAEAMTGQSSYRNLADQISRNRDGGWAWAGGAPTMTDGLFRRLKEHVIHYGRPEDRRLSFEELGNYDLWRLVRHYAAGDTFRKKLTATQRRYVDATLRDLRAFSADEVADAVAKNRGLTRFAEEDLIAEVAKLREARDDILDGRSVYNLERTAELRVPDEHVRAAEAEAIDRTLVHDPEWEAVTHPHNVAEVRQILDEPAALSRLPEVVARDPVMSNRALEAAERAGQTMTEWLTDPTNLTAIRSALVDDALPMTVPGAPAARTPLDEAILAGDKTELEAVLGELGGLLGRIAPPRSASASDRLASTLEGRTIRPGQEAASQRANVQAGMERGGTAESGGAMLAGPRPPVTNVPQDIAARVTARGVRRQSTRLRAELVHVGADLNARPDPAILANPANKVGKQVLSLLNRGTLDTEPATINGVASLLREIENGNAANMGIGPELAAEAQRVARELLERASVQAKAAAFPTGAFTKGTHPALLGEEDFAFARDLLGRKTPDGRDVVLFDPSDLTGLQYGFKKRPKDAVVLELSQVPGMAEELMTGYFKPWQERVWTAQIRQAFNYLFGPLHNTEIALQVRTRFVERSVALGVDPVAAGRVWRAWKDAAAKSRGTIVEKRGGERLHVAGDNPLYGDVRNIPNAELDRIAREALDDYYAGSVPAELRAVDYAEVFRESSSGIRRHLADNYGKLGDLLAATYGKGVHNKYVTTMYYWFRFGLDLRFHAMNFFEAPILYFGRAGLRPGKLDEGALGYTEQYLRNLTVDGLNDTGYPFSRSRTGWAYRTFLKEQQPALTNRLKGLQAEDPALMESALREIATKDPELAHTIRVFGDDPDKWLGAMDKWYRRMVDAVDPGREIDASIAEIVDRLPDTPALAEVYSQLAQVNKNLWDDIRGTFYGNPQRSRVERWMNHYLLYWPISYQIKATRWLAHVLFDRAAGLKTNAGGAVTLDRLMAEHNRMLVEDPEYQEWFERNPTLVFASQMLMPISWNSIGVSLSPPLRDAFFGRSKAITQIGPVYTFTKFLPELAGDIYPSVADLPGMDFLFRALAGERAIPNRAPQPKARPAEEPVGEPFDPVRFGG